jgi:PAS domain S-box-containing protein
MINVAHLGVSDASSFLSGGGKMGALMRAHDWSTSPLDHPSTWPQSLRSAVGLMLATKHMMFVAWGPELAFLYNDGYAPVFGAKHPRALGRPFREVWPEIWDDLEPLVSTALAGEATWSENLHLVMERNGYPEDAWFTFSYSPLRDESGAVAGMFCAGAETTAQVLAERRQAFRIELEERLREPSDPVAVMTAAVTALGEYLGADRVGYGQVLPNDATVRLSSCYADGVEPLLGDFPLDGFGPGSIARQRRGESVACCDVAADPDHDPAVWAVIDTRAFVSVPLVRDGRFTASLYVNRRAPHRWTAEELTLIEEVAARTWSAVERARAEAAQRRSEELLRSVLASVQGIVFAKDLNGRYLLMNEAGTRVHGKTPEEAVGHTDEELFGPEAGALLRANDVVALGSGAPLIVEESATINGIPLTYQTTKSPFYDASGEIAGVVGVSIDVTERKAAEAALVESEARFRLTADAVPQIVWITDADGRTEFFNKQWTDYTGVPYQATTAADVAANHVHPYDAEATVAAFDEARRTGGTFLVEHRILSKEGEYRWFFVRGEPYRDPQTGEVVRWFGASIDIHDRRVTEAALRESQARLLFLDRLGEETASLADADAVLSTTTRLLGEHLNLSVCAYADMDDDEDGFTIRGDWAAPGATSIVGHYSLADFGRLAVKNLSAGLPLVVNDNLRELAPEEAATFQNIGIAATICMPLVKNGRLTALMAIHDCRPRSWTEAELTLLREVTARSWAHVERVGAAAGLRESEARQAFLLSLADSLRSLSTPAEIAWTAAERLGEEFSLNRVFYAEYFGSLMRIERDYTQGVDSIAGEHNLEAFGPDLLRAYHDNAIVKVDDVGTDERFSEEARAGLRTRQVGAYLDVVLFEEEHWVGLLAFQSATARKWTATEESLFRDVGERVRSAMERARAEEQLRNFNERLEAQVAERTAERDRIWQLIPDLLMVGALDGRLLAVNPAWTDVLGFDEVTLLSRPFWELIHPESIGASGDAVREMQEGRVARHQNRVRTADGGYRWFDWVSTPVGENFYAVARDITAEREREAELEAAQEQLRQSQKMEAMGQLTGGVAHDFNNLLTPIVGSLDMLQRRGLGNEREQRLISGAMQSAERAKTLVQRLLAFARRQPLQAVAVDLKALVNGMAGLIGSTLGPKIDIRVELADDLPPAKADPNQLEMAILNLGVNARDAMPNGGTLTIVGARESVNIGNKAGLKQGHYVRLSVSDTGVGMDQATMARAVEPFFSTKGVGKGTGLGLSMVHGLAAQLGGAVTIASNLGEGTTIDLWLPLGAGPLVSDDAAPVRPAELLRGQALLVDDEELVRMSTADMLNDLGYEVIEASSAEEALALLSSGTRADVLVTDHLMPGMSGADLAREVRKIKPGLPILIVSGYAEADGIAPDLPRLTKPFRNADLAEQLAGLQANVRERV